MANQNIWEMDPLPAVADDTMIPVIATDDDASTNNKMSASQFAAYMAAYIGAITRTVYVGTSAQFQYKSIYQAWEAFKPAINVVVCEDITEDGDVVFSNVNNYLSITHAYPVTVNRGDFNFVGADVTSIVLKINGSFSTWERNYTSSKSGIDFKTNSAQNVRVEIVDFIDFDQSDQANATPFFTASTLTSYNYSNIRNVTLFLNNNGTSTNEFVDSSLENITLRCNDGRDSANCILLEGTSKISGLSAYGDFRAGAIILTVNKYSSYYHVSNLGSSEVVVQTNGGNGVNLYGINSTLNISMLGDEAAIISPKVVNANNTTFQFLEGTTANNSSGSICNSDVISVDNTGLKDGNFKFSNCQIPTQLTWAGDTEVVQFSNCNFPQGYTIESKNTIMVNALAGLSGGGGSENIAVDTASGQDGSIIIAVQGNADFSDPTISTDQVLQGFNKELS